MQVVVTFGSLFNDFGNAASVVVSNPDISGANTTANVAEMLKTEGAETWAPMAVTVIFGLAAATILTLIVEPCIYVVMGKRIAKKMCLKD